MHSTWLSMTSTMQPVAIVGIGLTHSRNTAIRGSSLIRLTHVRMIGKE